MDAQTAFLRSLGVEIFGSGLRRWSEKVKAQAVAETLEPGATVNAVAARYGMKPNQLSAWRCLAKEGKLVLPAAEMSDEPTAFAPVVLCEPKPPQAPQPSRQSDDSLRLVFGDVTIALAADTPAVRIAEIVHALGASS
ncbi:IS66-like element accessory protein TnpA [Thioclava electrotropha]|uniref:IS66-like element accessory protein TnpA n=1 Tax=Thioclava electrotropha TaxID=1549850 RepID=UPI0023A83561|nr:transposase [Thioclava electrotropha]